MDNSGKMAPQTSLFQVYLRLRPPIQQAAPKQTPESWLIVEPPSTPVAEVGDADNTNNSFPTHITLQPPNDSRKRAVERFGFTKIFQQDATQLDMFDETGTVDMIRKVLQTGRDGLVATLGVTGSGKSHTILGSKTQRGLTQMTLDVLFRSIGDQICRPDYSQYPTDTQFLSTLQACDSTEAQILPATAFLESVFSDGERARLSRAQTPMSRAQTPMTVCSLSRPFPGPFPGSFPVSPMVSSTTLPTAAPIAVEKLLESPTHIPMMPTIGEVLHQPVEKEPWHPPSKTPVLAPVKRWYKSPAKLKVAQESAHHPRKPPMPLPSSFPQFPDVSSFAMGIDPDAEYAVLVSMYEVYNDRIFDLLSNPATQNAPQMSTRQGAAIQKGLLRRPLLFKNTEMSPDRKVVAGLRKIVCGSYEEAMMVLEAGLAERRVAGTGSNSVSSRSHGFFCIEVRQKTETRNYGGFHAYSWTGGTMSIVDLAGSERARNAKTTGSTLAEAGKINESLMYLGQCLQVQSDCQQEGSKPIVPFRQCKLTELLFSNSFPSSSGHASSHRAPQKAVMIVTADPQGDFNATSQMLRYSALAREVTVPRIPSVTSAIIGHQAQVKSGRTTPHDMPISCFPTQELEQAVSEAARLSDECDILSVRLAQEEIKRTEAEFKLQATEEKLGALEQEIREECYIEMEERMEDERYRWRQAWEQERIKGEEYVDGKLDIIGRTAAISIHEDPVDQARVDELERENDELRAKLRALEQEMATRSPSKKARSAPKTPAKGAVLSEGPNTNIATNPFLAALRKEGREFSLDSNDDELHVSDVSPRKLSLRSSTAGRDEEPKSTTKKTRKLTTRKWDLGDPEQF